jgi:hypothetical protein
VPVLVIATVLGPVRNRADARRFGYPAVQNLMLRVR